MKDKNKPIEKKNAVWRSAKECAYIAVFVALVIASQFAFAAVPGVELVTVLFVAYAYVFGCVRAMAAATAFALLRQFIFGLMPTVLILYLIYYNLLALCFGGLGRAVKNPVKGLVWIIGAACVCTVCFTLLDDCITPLYYAYSAKAARLYFYASLPVMGTQTVCAGVSVALLFLPLQKAFGIVRRTLPPSAPKPKAGNLTKNAENRI